MRSLPFGAGFSHHVQNKGLLSINYRSIISEDACAYVVPLKIRRIWGVTTAVRWLGYGGGRCPDRGESLLTQKPCLPKF